jgi:two-component system, OmpR family, phosphate regulon sensor histidine kinase PhoR
MKPKVKLRVLFTLLFVALAMPVSYLSVKLVYSLGQEKKFGDVSRANLISDILVGRTQEVIRREDRRSFAEYKFLMAVSLIGKEELSLSPLAISLQASDVPGMIGYFQMEQGQEIHSPLLPEGSLKELQVPERKERIRIRGRVSQVVTPYKDSLFLDRASSEDVMTREEMSSKKQAWVNRIQRWSGRNLSRKKAQFHAVEIWPFQIFLTNGELIFSRKVIYKNRSYAQGFVVNSSRFFANALNKIEMMGVIKDFSGLSIELQNAQDSSLVYRVGGMATSDQKALLLANPLEGLHLYIRDSEEAMPDGMGLVLFLGTLALIVSGGGLYSLYRIVLVREEVTHKRQDFVSAVSHELKTPLTAVMMYCELLEEGMVSSEEKKMKYIRRIHSESARLFRMIRNVLQLSAIEKQNHSLNMITVPLIHVFSEVQESLIPILRETGFVLLWDLEDDEKTVKVDRDALIQILLNLVENSIKFAKESRTKQVKIGVKDVFKGQTSIYVRDYGPGVPPGELEQIFEIFYRSEKEMTRKTNGTGVGLGLVKGLIDQMGLSVQARNVRPGLETIVTFPSELA